MNTLQAFLSAQAKLASLAPLGPRVYSGEYQIALANKRAAKGALIASQKK
jgi:hypothetical protein